MKKYWPLLLFVSCLTFTPLAHAAITLGNQGNGGLGVTCSTATSSSFACTLSQTPTAGDLLILSYVNSAQTPTVNSISGAGTWFKAIGANGNALADDETWYDPNNTAGTTTITITLSGTSGATARANVSEWAGMQLTSSTLLDVAASSTSGSAGTVTTGLLSPTTGLNELIIASYKGGNQATGPTNGFTAMNTSSAAAQEAYLIIPTTSGNVSTSWTQSATSYNTNIVAFKAASTTATTPDALFFAGD
jgi:hypothetical protein